MGGLALPPIGKPSDAGNARRTGRPTGSSSPGGPSRTGLPTGGSTRSRHATPIAAPNWIPVLLIAALWTLLALGVVAVAIGIQGWQTSELSVQFHVAGATVSFFGSVVALAGFRREITRTRLGGRHVERRFQGLRLNTAVALLAWSCGVLQVALIGLHYSSQFSG